MRWNPNGKETPGARSTASGPLKRIPVATASEWPATKFTVAVSTPTSSAAPAEQRGDTAEAIAASAAATTGIQESRRFVRIMERLETLADTGASSLSSKLRGPLSEWWFFDLS